MTAAGGPSANQPAAKPTASQPAPSPTRPAARPTNWPYAVAAAIAGLLVASALFLPLWRAQLQAPQYPGGLELIAYGDRVEGDVAEISSLNHYIGMRPFQAEDLPELRLWPLALGLATGAIALSAVYRRRLPARLARGYVWLLPLGVLGVIQFRLYQYGHDLDPRAALRVPEFTPWVIGPTRVWNFTTWSWPGTGLLALLAAAAVLSFGPALLERIRRRAASP